MKFYKVVARPTLLYGSETWVTTTRDMTSLEASVMLLDDLEERRGDSQLKEEVLNRTMWRAGFGRGFGPVVRQTT